MYFTVEGPRNISTTSSSFSFNPLNIGGGGYVTGVSDFMSDGTKVCRSNSGSCYLWNGSKWVTLWTNTNLPTNVWGSGQTVYPGGCYELRVAPSNTNVFYGIIGRGNSFGGAWIVSTDKGSTWTDTGLAI